MFSAAGVENPFYNRSMIAYGSLFSDIVTWLLSHFAVLSNTVTGHPCCMFDF
jgi:hypothetical protein